MPRPGRMVDTHLKDHPPTLPLPPSCSPVVLIRIGRGQLFFLFNYLINFCHTRALSIHLCSFWHSWYKNIPLQHLGQWGQLPSVPWLSMVGPGIRKPGDATALQPTPHVRHAACTSKGASWSFGGTLNPGPPLRSTNMQNVCTGPMVPAKGGSY